jgi:uncharacterized protein YndB with AHSA1/START domain
MRGRLKPPANRSEGIKESDVATSIITHDLDAVVSEIDIAAPPEKVFQALIDREQALQWGTTDTFELTDWKMDARPGGSWGMLAKEKGVNNSDGVPRTFHHHGEVLEVDPPRVLAYTWFANWHEDPSLRTIVRWELAPTATGTHVKVTHSGLAQLPAARAGYSQGWPGLLRDIKNYLEK